MQENCSIRHPRPESNVASQRGEIESWAPHTIQDIEFWMFVFKHFPSKLLNGTIVKNIRGQVCKYATGRAIEKLL